MLTLHAVAGNLFQINNLQLQLESTFLVNSLVRVNKNGDEELDEKGRPIKPASSVKISCSRINSISSLHRVRHQCISQWFYLLSHVGRWSPRFDLVLLAPVVQKVDSAIHWINLYPLDRVIGFPNTYLQDSNLSGGQRYPTFEQPELGPYAGDGVKF